MSRPRGRWPAAWLLVTCAVGLLLVYARRQEPRTAYFGRGYVEGARAMIDSQFVRLDCDSMRITTHFPQGSPAERWFSLSYLREDVRRFNSDPERVPGPFLVDYDECRLEGVDRYYHRIELPFSPNLAWRGDVLLAGGRRTAVLENRSTPQTVEVRPAADAHDATSERVGWPQQVDVFPATALFQMRTGPSGSLLSELYFVGEDLVLADRRKEGAPYQIRVGGYPLFEGRVVRIETGDWIQFSATEPPRGRGPAPASRAAPTYLARVGSDSRLASFVRVQNDEVDRLYPLPYLRPFVAPFSQAMSNALQAGNGTRSRAGLADSVVLTLDRDLGEELNRTVSAWCRATRRPDRPRAVSMLVMDAFSGAVRALPSCPADEEISSYAGLSPAERERWLRNQNLLRHEIGSAGKPFWAAALASAYPNLLDVQVEAHGKGPIPSILGCRLPAAYSDHAHPGDGQWVGMEAFLASSCNRYIVELATGALALGEGSGAGHPCTGHLEAADFRTCFAAAAPTDSATRLRICDGVVRAVLSTDSRFVAQDCNHLKLIGAEFRPVPNLRDITNVEWFSRGAPDRLVEGSGGGEGQTGSREGYQFGRYRTGVWRRVTDALTLGGPNALAVETGLRFAAVSPEEANLQLNKVDELRAEWVSVLLGGATSRWSNFQLAEALSRLVTGRAVEGEFVDSMRAPWLGGTAAALNARREFGPIPPSSLDDGVRRRVLHGMELVAQNGTADLLRHSIDELSDSLARVVPGETYELYVFAKTGTPTVSKHVASRGQDLVRELMRYLRWDPATLRVVVAPGGEQILRRRNRNAAYWARWFQQDVRAPLEADPTLFQASPGEPLPNHPLYLVGNQLRRNPRRDVEVTRQGGVLVLGLLAVPRAQGRAASQGVDAWISACPDAELRASILGVPPARTLNQRSAVGVSVAIYLDDLDVGTGSGKAVQLADRSMNVLGRYLLRQVREKARAQGRK
ncbi:MAG: hypothetical protein ACJ8GN_15960 [Longimicrobiaceae bacterium]